MTPQKVTPCLWFDGQAEEAAAFYTSVFPDSGITKVTPGPTGAALVVEFHLAGVRFIALNGGPQYKFTEAVSFQVSAAGQEEVDRYTEQLTAGGGEIGPCGWVKDRFGLSWQIVPDVLPQLVGDPNPLRASAAVQAMLKMTKIDIEGLRAAADAAAPA